MTKLPPTNEDPAVLAARAAKQTFDQQLRALRANGDLSDLARARQINQAHQTLLATLREHGNDLHQRRVDHYNDVSSRVAIGAAIPADTSPADKAVLMQAFTSALDRVRGMDVEKLEKTFREAARFGDDATQRAIETVVIEEGGFSSLREVIRAVNPERVAAIEEWGEARDLVENRGTEGSFAVQAFNLITTPSEVKNLSTLESHEAKRQQAERLNYVPTAIGF